MDILIFKTSIRYKKDLKIIKDLLNGIPSVIHWNVDREDVDNVLRIESKENNPRKIVTLLKRIGYHCEELS